MKTCEWERDIEFDDDSTYDTQCGNMFSVMEGTPANNGFKFCPYCGGEIVYDPNDNHR